MRVKKLVGRLSIVLALLISCAAMATAEFDQAAAMEEFWKSPDSTVLATVNGEQITKGDLLKMLWDWSAPGALEELINQKMINQAATAAGVEIDTAEVDEKIQEQMEKLPESKTMPFKSVLRKYNMTETRLRRSTMISLMAERTVQKDVKIPEEQFDEWAMARHILIRPNPQEEDKEKADADAKSRAEKVLASLKAGEKFEELAALQSDDLSNKEDGGALGWFKKGRMVKEFEDAIFGSEDQSAMKAGEISQAPVKSMFGYHIIEVQKMGREASAEDKAEIRDMILQEEVPTKMRDWYNNLKESAKIDNKLNPPLPPEPAPESAPPPAPASE